jgi:hypothetical protein
MRSDLDDDSRFFPVDEEPLHRFRCRLHAVLLDDATASVENTDPAEAVTEVASDRHQAALFHGRLLQRDPSRLSRSWGAASSSHLDRDSSPRMIVAQSGQMDCL